MVQGVSWSMFLYIGHFDLVIFIQCLFQPFQKYFELQTLLEEWFMGKPLDVLAKVVGFVGGATLVDLVLVLWFLRIDPL